MALLISRYSPSMPPGPLSRETVSRKSRRRGHDNLARLYTVLKELELYRYSCTHDSARNTVVPDPTVDVFRVRVGPAVYCYVGRGMRMADAAALFACRVHSHVVHVVCG